MCDNSVIRTSPPRVSQKVDTPTTNVVPDVKTLTDALKIRDDKFQLLVDEVLKLKAQFEADMKVKTDQIDFIYKKYTELQKWVVDNMAKHDQTPPATYVAPPYVGGASSCGDIIRTSPVRKMA